jgi:S-adenosylmethionine synthetase
VPVSVHHQTAGHGAEKDDRKQPASANHGHFGRSRFSWEKTDRIGALIAAVKRLTAIHAAKKG